MSCFLTYGCAPQLREGVRNPTEEPMKAETDWVSTVTVQGRDNPGPDSRVP